MSRPAARFPVPGVYSFTALLWSGYVVVVGLVLAAMALLGAVSGSVWDPAAQLLRWYALAVSAWSFAVCLPLHVAHGRTRREFLARSCRFAVLMSGLLALLTATGYLLEMLVYRHAGWPQTFADTRPFGSPMDLPALLFGPWLGLLCWSTAGALVGAAFHRDALMGLGAVPPALALATTSKVATGGDPMPFVDRFVDPFDPYLPHAALVCALACAAALALIWLLVREVPVRSRAG